MTAAPEEKFILISMLNLTQATTVLTKHILLFLNIFSKIRLIVWQIIQTLSKIGNWALYSKLLKTLLPSSLPRLN
ncbi:hypothetical protein CK510_23590 [Brunnivagina elsteri CCALA 953]|uniref:Uncharacterized protein n=1 Tax=Brunnivagina elsteri CCALA 953 TaxID=987040 RepID=A0A2A2TCX9_9CYAN|nr:hypothetical protein CK510_23590 [Calothrix elsteri CCALA 953]